MAAAVGLGFDLGNSAGLRVQGFGSRIQGLGFRGLGFKVEG